MPRRIANPREQIRVLFCFGYLNTLSEREVWSREGAGYEWVV